MNEFLSVPKEGDFLLSTVMRGKEGSKTSLHVPKDCSTSMRIMPCLDSNTISMPSMLSSTIKLEKNIY